MTLNDHIISFAITDTNTSIRSLYVSVSLKMFVPIFSTNLCGDDPPFLVPYKLFVH